MHSCLDSVNIGFCNFFCCVIICKMSTLAVRVGAVYPEEVDLTESHVKRHFRSQWQYRCLYHAVCLNVSADFVAFGWNGMDVSGIDRFFAHAAIGALCCKQRSLYHFGKFDAKLGCVNCVRYTVKWRTPVGFVKNFVYHVCTEGVFIFQ